jgi:2-polyprenyl-6-methoxyphenol hydroxylase-like FAD-dependent oxidoreductase
VPTRHAIVVGAGPAGIAAAAGLSQGGCDVTIVEAGRFPRDKVCGECFSALGQASLRRIGLGETFEQLRPLRLERVRLAAKSGREATFHLPQPIAGVTRKAMDTALLDALRDRVEVVHGRVVAVEPGKRPRVKLRDREIEADVVLLADGKGTLRGGLATPPRPTGDVGLKAHFHGIDLPRDLIGLFGLRGHYVGVAPVRDGNDVVWNVAMSLPAAVAQRAGRDFDGLLDELCEQNVAFGRAMRAAERAGDWLASPLPRFAVRPTASWGQNVVPVGNAAAALEPVGGEGMGLAVASAAVAAEHVLAGRPMTELAAAYRQLWRVRRPVCRSIAMAMSRPTTAACTVGLARLLPAAAWVGMRLAGKSDGVGSFTNRPAAVTVA